MNLLREIESKCGQKFLLPFPIPPNTEEGLLAIARDIWTLNFYCPICRKVERIQKQRLAWVVEETMPKSPTRLGEVPFQISFECGQAGCESLITLHVLGDENETAGDVRQRYFGLRVSCSQNHPSTELKGNAIPTRQHIFNGSAPPSDKFIEFFQCHNCNKPYRVPLSTRLLLGHILPSQSKGKPSVFFACEACNDLRLYSTRDLPTPHIYDIGEGGRAIYVGKFFRARISCGDSKCESRIEVIAPTTDAYYLEAMTRNYSLQWNPQDVACAPGHPVRKPVSLISIEELSL